ncbi:hypothetical protein KP806_00955 [Paenibacillus sp. N4]|uniref:hypothetical protein n=1 Tax=Paenibacillus vietnamensis TaxID=2590547 RepID=UPI001CD153AD|nr:hypothetical protein [Paenibacillus vietnamensis]MCA0753602.1 hypothetical protein [Paenibacillus vietnamensis]
MIQKKNCLFCGELAAIDTVGRYERFNGCFCAPGGSYTLFKDSYAAIQSFPYAKKRGLFPIVSGYIRELTDCEEKVSLTLEEVDAIESSPKIPATIEEKEAKLLQFLYRHSEGAGDPVTLQPLSQHFNLTYSPNLQEFVYIIEKLRDVQFITREGGTLRLTEEGWKEAVARQGGKKLKKCLILISSVEEYGLEWSKVILPKVEQYGYEPCVINYSDQGKQDSCPTALIAESKLIIADATRRSPEVYCAAGYGHALDIPLLWTVKSDRMEPDQAAPFDSIRQIEWDTVDQLSTALTNAMTNTKNLQSR